MPSDFDWPFPQWLKTIYSNIFSIETVLAHLFLLGSLAIYQYGLVQGCLTVAEFLLFSLKMCGPIVLFLVLSEYTHSLPGRPPEANVLDVLAMAVVFCFAGYWCTLAYRIHHGRPLGYSVYVNAAMAGMVGALFTWVLFECGQPELEYTKILPWQMVQACIYVAKTAPRVAYRYFILRDKVNGGNFAVWWARDDRMQNMVANFIDDIQP